MNARALIRSLGIAGTITFVTDAMSQSEATLFMGLGSGAPWHAENEDGRGKVEADMGPLFSIGVGFADRIEEGKTAWMRLELLYSNYQIDLDARDQSLCCFTRDSAVIDLQLVTLRIGPEFEIGRYSRFYIPLDLSLPMASKASGYRSSFIPPNQTQRTYVNERSNYGRFNVSVGAGVSFGLPISETYVLSIGPMVSLGLFDQAATISNVRIYNYALGVGLRRKVSTPKFLLHD